MFALLLACTAPGVPGAGDSPGRDSRGGDSPGGDSVDSAPGVAPGPYNVLLILTDDEWVYDAPAFPERDERFAPGATVFSRAYASNPMCCPARSSFLASGHYSRDTGVLGNRPPNGGGERLDLSRTLPVALQRAGYRTALIGKYLNNAEIGEHGIPPGWTYFDSLALEADWASARSMSGSSTPDAAGEVQVTDVSQYVTDYLVEGAVRFIEDSGDQPFFLWVSHYAPHYPAIPAPGDRGQFAGSTRREGGFNEVDVSDKPAYVRAVPRLGEETMAKYDLNYQSSLESLLAVDRGTGLLLDTLERLDLVDNTVVIYASDNGYLWGEHRLYGKGMPYESSVRVPLIVRLPGGEAGVLDTAVSTTTDIPATVLAAAGLPCDGPGLDLAGAARGTRELPARPLFLESFGLDGEGYALTPWSAVLSYPWKYVAYASGEVELYHLGDDPWEENNIAGSGGEAEASLAAWLAPERALAAVDVAPIYAEAGAKLDMQLESVGGQPPLSWAAAGLPARVALDPSGRLHGTREWADTEATATVTDSSVSPYDGTAQAYTLELRFLAAEAHALSIRTQAEKAGTRLVLGPGRGPVSVDYDASPALDLSPRTWTGQLSATAETTITLPSPAPGRCLHGRVRSVTGIQGFESCVPATTSR